MKKFIAILIASAFALSTDMVKAQVVVSEDWGRQGSQQRQQVEFDDDLTGSSPEEDELLQSLYNEEEDEELSRILKSEDFIFPSSITDNWHLTLQFGAVNSWGSYTRERNFWNLTNFGGAFSIGKYLTPVNDVRITGYYGRGTGVRGTDMVFMQEYLPKYEAAMNSKNPTEAMNKLKEEWQYAKDGWTLEKEKAAIDHSIYNWNTFGISLQWLPNITNLIKGYDPDRKFTVSGIFGIGVEYTSGYTNKNLSEISVWAEGAKRGVSRTLIGLQFGAQADYALSDRWHVNFEVQENFLDNSFDGLISGRLNDKNVYKDDTWDGHLNLFLGVTWFLKGKLNNGRLQNRNPFNDKYNEIEERIYKNREALDDALANRPVDVNYVEVTKDVTYTLISFDENVLEVPRLQQNNVFTTATVYDRNPNSKIFITNSSKIDDKTFHERAWSISKLLNRRWQIPLEDIWVDADESHIQKLQLPDCKHYIILIIND